MDFYFCAASTLKTDLRLVATIPHPHCRISIHSYNEKWIIEFEGGVYRQAYKISQENIPDLEQVKKLLSAEFIHQTLDRFNGMHRDLGSAIAALKNKDV